MADEGLPELGGQHTLHGGLHLADGVVDDPVHPHIHVAPGGAVPCRRVGPDVEAHDDGLGGCRQHHITFADSAHAGVDDPHPDLLVAQLLQAGLHRLGGALDVSLDNDVQILDLTGLDLAEQVLKRDLLHGSVGLGPLLRLPLLHQLPGQTLIGHGVEGAARSGHLAQTGDLHRHGGPGLGDAVALVVQHGPHAAHGGTGDDDVPGLQRTVLDQQGGHGAPALVQPGLHHGVGGRAGGFLPGASAAAAPGPDRLREPERPSGQGPPAGACRRQPWGTGRQARPLRARRAVPARASPPAAYPHRCPEYSPGSSE